MDHQRVVEVVGEVDDVESALDRDLQQRRCALVKRAGCVDDDVTWMEARLQGVTLFDVHLSVRRGARFDSSRTQGFCNRRAEKAAATEQHDPPQACLRPITAAQGQNSAKSTPEQTATPRKLPARVNAESPNPAAQMVQVQVANQPLSPGVARVSKAPATV